LVRYQLQGPFLLSVNAKQIEQSVFPTEPSRCEPGHGYQFVYVAQLD
jgi:hypothetical protein